MKVKHLCLLSLALIALTTVRGQNGDDIPMENDNQFPPEQQAAPNDGDVLEGSGSGPIEQTDTTDKPSSTTTEQPQIEDMFDPSNKLLNEPDIIDKQDKGDIGQLSCPEKCSCNAEGEDFTTECSGLELSELPTGIDNKTTKLKLQNNKLTEIPKEISSLINLKFLNASNNLIQDLALGSISTLSGLRVLDLQKNRLLQFPMDLQNSFDLTKLETLNLGRNDIREKLSSDVLGKFTSLEKIVVPSNAFDEQVEVGLCKSLTNSLKIICVETCEKEINCPDYQGGIEHDMLEAKIPATIFLDDDSESDPTINTPDINYGTPNAVNNETASDKEPISTLNPENGSQDAPETSLNDLGKTEEAAAISKFSTLVEAGNSDISVNVRKVDIPAVNSENKQEETQTDKNESSNYKVGATTSDSKSGGVNKSTIGIIVACMVVIVAGITIKKNWTNIRKRFSSDSRTPDRPVGNTNGTTSPEEVPLQDKSPV
ncbi:uncharacterized protein LOC106141169 [Amyelois transitella]|uniref:uncharacterized protein LOC106141169 n=1 Tax=Amyelois transitella TaxID=680683 RepID=UPI00298FCDD7|nr:uncharacterized protein LOC106141169 [Amyelois transitella]